MGLVELFAGVGGLRRAMERCGVFAAHVAVEGEAAAQRVLMAAWPDVHVVDHVADLSIDTLPQIVEKGPHVRTWIVGASLSSNLVAAHQELQGWSPMPRSLLSQSALIDVDAEMTSKLLRNGRETASNFHLTTTYGRTA